MKLQLQLALWDIEKYIFRDAWEAFRAEFWPRKPWQPKEQLTRAEILAVPYMRSQAAEFEDFEAISFDMNYRPDTRERSGPPEWVTLL